MKDIDLQLINKKCHNTQLNKRFSGILIRSKTPYCVARLFSNGTMILLGANSTDNALLAAKKIANNVSNILNKYSN